jgi:signal transduction histidine kinase
MGPTNNDKVFPKPASIMIRTDPIGSIPRPIDLKDVDGAGEVIIKSQPSENEQLQVSVSDTGVVLPQQQADEIFNAFFTTKLQGTGLGLSISRSIVESHGGRLWAAITFPRGARFCFTLSTKVEAPE